ncbi:MAG TPA: M13 family metallopeptidase [Polyangiaceae bacterium LLY-WYZ-14_1]|nr:M13 family metallopeptidase [Polyangiaceae bacterium LLY-WYZ-14_1]
MRPVLFLALGALCGCGGGSQAGRTTTGGPDTAPAPSGDAEIGDWGFALDDMDREIDPGDDFFRFANGAWLETFEIPSDFSNYGAFTVLFERSEAQVRAILEEAASASGVEPGSNTQKIGDYYGTFLDVDAIQAKGLAPAQEDLAFLGGLDSHEAVAGAMGRADLRTESPVGVWIDLDAKNTDRYLLQLTQAGLGLPDRDYYLEDRFAEERTKYRAYVEQMLDLAGIEGAGDKAEAIVTLETEMAKVHWPRAKRRDRNLTYNLTDQSALETAAPGFPWDPFLASLGVDAQAAELNLREQDAVVALAAMFRETPVPTWSAYLQFHYLRSFASVLPQALDEATFDFYGRTLSGQPEQKERWKRAVAATNDALGEVVGQEYVARHFPPEAKAAMEALVDNVKQAFGRRLDDLDWMGDDTKAEARAKLAKFTTKIGYPDRWKDYGELEVVAGDALSNAKRASAWAWDQDAQKLGGPVDRTEWFMTPQTVNAYYSPTRNEIVFPAAILQAPFFDPEADPAVNYGGIGAVIGHEIGHGFDDQGRKSDGDGLLRDWWTAEDLAGFEDRAAKLGGQYGTYEPIPGMPLDPELTMGENIGDLGGLTLAYDAYRISLGDQEAPVLDGFTGDQRFFLAWAQVWKRKYREEELRRRIVTDPHSPSEFRTNGIVRNLDAWYAAFDVDPDDALYLPPEERVSIW